jgi:hypothetical protein
MPRYLDDQTTNLYMRTAVANAALEVANAQVEFFLAKTFNDKKVAKAAMLQAGAVLADLTGEAAELYRNEMVDRISAQDGKTVMKCRRCDIGGPCDPGMELHWTM